MKGLKRFLVEAKKNTYASGDENIKKIESDNSTTIVYKSGEYKYHDNYFGGEPFGGREVVFKNGKEIYMMVYYGYVKKGVENINEIYNFLMYALKNIPEDYPYRGPEKIVGDKYVYENSWNGEIDNFYGNERITDFDGNIIYEDRYIGGEL
jgi:hypothetical protein